MTTPDGTGIAPRLISRRAAMEMAILVVGTLSSSATRAMAAGVATKNTHRAVFAAPQRAMVSALAELIIPETDTPGAIEAGVPRFIENMVSEWYTDVERRIFLDGLVALDVGCVRDHGRNFIACNTQQQTQALGAAELAARDYPPADPLAKDGYFDGNTPFFTKLRELTVLGYYTSELGATRELRYNPVPGHFDGNLPWTPESRQWSS